MKIYGHAMRRSDLYLFVLARNKAEATEKVIAIEKDYCHTFGQTFQEPDKHYVYFVSYAEYKSYLRNTKAYIAELVRELKAIPLENSLHRCLKEEAISRYRKYLAALENPIT